MTSNSRFSNAMIDNAHIRIMATVIDAQQPSEHF